MRFLTFLAFFAFLPVAAHAFPTKAERQRACTFTKGVWRELPEWCGNMRPGVWKQLSVKQREYCYNINYSPCFCGEGRTFSHVNVLGCVPDPFLKYKSEQKKPYVPRSYKELLD